MRFFDRFRKPNPKELETQSQQEQTSKQWLFNEQGDKSLKTFGEINVLLKAGASDEEIKAVLGPIAPTQFLQMRGANRYWGSSFDWSVSNRQSEGLEPARTLMLELRDRYFQSRDRQLRTYIVKTCLSLRAAMGDKTHKPALLALDEIMAAEGLEKRGDSYAAPERGEAAEHWLARPREGDIDPSTAPEQSPPPETLPRKSALYPPVLATLTPIEQTFLARDHWATDEAVSPELQLRQLFDRIRSTLFDVSQKTDRKTVAEAGRLLQAIHNNPNLLNVIADPAQREDFRKLTEELWEIKGQTESQVFQLLLQRAGVGQPEAQPIDHTVPPLKDPSQPPTPELQTISQAPNLIESVAESLSGGFAANLKADWSLPPALLAKLTDDRRLEALVDRIDQHLQSPDERTRAEAGRMLYFIHEDAEHLLNQTRDLTIREGIRRQLNYLWEDDGEQANQLWREKFQTY